MTAPQTTDDSDAFTRAVQRVRAEFLEMPGLTLTVAQASRLWSFEASFCMAVLGALEEARFLVRTRHSAFARADRSRLLGPAWNLNGTEASMLPRCLSDRSVRV
jgi:hypothetical protein